MLIKKAGLDFTWQGHMTLEQNLTTLLLNYSRRTKATVVHSTTSTGYKNAICSTAQRDFTPGKYDHGKKYCSSASCHSYYTASKHTSLHNSLLFILLIRCLTSRRNIHYSCLSSSTPRKIPNVYNIS